MAATTHLGMTYLDTNQVDQPLVFNNALTTLDSAVYALQQGAHRSSDGTAGRTVTVSVNNVKLVFKDGLLVDVTTLSGTTIAGAAVSASSASSE